MSFCQAAWVSLSSAGPSVQAMASEVAGKLLILRVISKSKRPARN